MIAQGVIDYSAFYRKPMPPGRLNRFKKYPTDAIIMELAKINAILYQELGNQQMELKRIVTEVFPQLDSVRKHLLAALLADKDINEYPKIFSSPSISYLYSFCFTHFRKAMSDEPIPVVQLQQDLWDGILIGNEIYYNRGNRHNDLGSYEAIWALGMMQQQYIRRFEYVSTIGQIKVLFFHRFVHTYFENSIELVNQFNKALVLTSFFDYALTSMSIISESLKNGLEQKQAKWAIEFNDVLHTMFAPFSLRSHHLGKTEKVFHVHKDIMTHPFYYLLDQHPIILDFNYLAYVVEFSLTFNFYRHTSLYKTLRFKDFKSFRGMLGKEYYEKFITGAILRALYSSKDYIVMDDASQGYPDFSIRDTTGRSLFLLEVKSVELSLETLERLAVEEFKEFINDQFASKKSETERNKGIFQLIDSIKRLSISEALSKLLPENSAKGKYEIYPIIIYTENVLDIAGVNAYINELFENEVAIYQRYFRKIHPVTLINQATFIEEYPLLKKQPRIIEAWIKGYWKRVISNRNSYRKSKHPYQFLRAGISFTHYLMDILPIGRRKSFVSELVDDLKLLKE